MDVVFLYSPKLQRYDYGPTHPMQVIRLRLTHDLLGAYGIFQKPGVALLEPQPAGREEAALFHTRQYLDFLAGLDTPEGITAARMDHRRMDHRLTQHGLGYGDNPVFPGIYTGSLLVTGGALQAARMVTHGEADTVFHIAGGLHHAMPDRASGFCYLNDPAIAIHSLVREGKRVVYLDIDAHHGDGVQHAFYETDQVLTISLHESGEFLFPGTGFVDEIGAGRGKGYSVNLPFYPNTGDSTFVHGFETIVPPLVERFRPDVLVTQLGVDSFADDPLTHLRLTTNGFCRMVQRMKSFDLPWVALGGGGYHIANVARAWTLAFGIMSSVELPEEIPSSCTAELRAYGLEGDRLRDPVPSRPEEPRVRQWADEQIRLIQKTIFPIHGL